MKQLGEHIQDIAKIHSIAVQDLEHNPHFTTESGLRIRQIKLSESVLRSKTLSAKDIKWKVYPQYFKCLWCNIEECHRQVRDIRTSMLLEMEANYQRKYTMDILQRKATLETMFPVESTKLYGTESYTLEAESESAEYMPRLRNHGALWNGRYGSAASASPNIGQSQASPV
ncbi:hypothetical protein C8J57DRAFT_1270877 [Mycena rebaudengoi]|nr:hypothetical protein C8J57DRAFT_1270877 [Mycena rebaudengoi]